MTNFGHQRTPQSHADLPLNFERMLYADRLSTVGLLTSAIAHELGTPLNVIAGRASLLHAGPAREPQVRRNAEIIAKQADRMTQLVRSLLVFARNRHSPDVFAPVVEVVGEAFQLLTPLTGKGKVVMEQTGDASATANMDRMTLLHVLVNLIMNSIQSMPDGGRVHLHTIHAQTASIRPHDKPSTHLHIRVEDSGSGISADDLKHVLDPFYSTKGALEGTGLGLTVCDVLVARQQGALSIESEPGSGTTVHLRLPTREA